MSDDSVKADDPGTTPTPEVTEDGYVLCRTGCPCLALGWKMAQRPGDACTIGELGVVIDGGKHDQCFRCEWRG